MTAAGITQLGNPDGGGEVTTTGGRRGDERCSAGSVPGCRCGLDSPAGGAGIGAGVGGLSGATGA